MLALRLQRVGRKKLAHFRLIAQEHSLSPKSGRVVQRLGNFNPHTKEFTFEKEAVETFLKNGAQPSNRVARLLKDNGVKLPSWVKIEEKVSKPKKEVEEKPEAPAEDTTADDVVAADEPTDDDNGDDKAQKEPAEQASDEQDDDTKVEEDPAEEPAKEEKADTEDDSKE